MLEQTDLLSSRFHQRAKQLYDKVLVRAAIQCSSVQYSKIEFAVDIPHNEKVQRTAPEPRSFSNIESPLHADMVDWWTLANENLLQESVPFTIVAEGVRKSNTALRPGVKDMCAFLHRQDVPMMVFSAGLGGA